MTSVLFYTYIISGQARRGNLPVRHRSPHKKKARTEVYAFGKDWLYESESRAVSVLFALRQPDMEAEDDEDLRRHQNEEDLPRIERQKEEIDERHDARHEEHH